MKIDLHVHTRERSPCGHSTTEDVIRAAIRSGLNAVAITDHDRLVPLERLCYLNAKYGPFRVFGGVEITLDREHVLVLGVHDELLERRRWTYRGLHRFVEERGGFLALAHPFRFNGRIELDVECYPPHALEIHSHNTPRRAETRIRAVAADLNVPLLSNSDAHLAREVGAYYNILDEVPEDLAALVALLKAGAFSCGATRPIGSAGPIE
jgi:predicted metal-dependent phosphoesterase TrpH